MKPEPATYHSWVEVVLPLAIPKLLTYAVPDEWTNAVQPGCRVVVHVGKNKLYTGIVYSIQNISPDGYEARPIDALLDQNPVVLPSQLAFWKWISSYYLSSLGEVMNVALPSGLRLSGESKVYLKNVPSDDVDLNEREHLIVEALQQKPFLLLDDVAKLLGIKTIHPYLKSLVDKGYIAVEQELKKGFVPKTETYIGLTDEADQEEKLKTIFDELIRAPKQLEALMYFVHLSSRYTDKVRNVKKDDLLKDERVSSQAIKELVKKNIFKEVKVETGRFHSSSSDEIREYELTSHQYLAFQSILTAFEKKKPVLLYGVTSSGKTEVYVSLIRKAIEEGKQVLYLLPEIALTSQLIHRLNKFFPGKIGVYHSRFNENERVEVWNHVLNFNETNTQFQIILGARSALFLPFQQLGLVIVDEEHDSSFKQQDPAPRYHARDSAIYLAQQHGASVILGSATPSIESYYNATHDKYELVEMKNRFGDVELPEIITADVRKEIKKKTMQSHFSSLLIQQIQQTIDQREQVILFQNRRGYSLVLQCHECGWNPMCKNCDISLIYHKSSHQLRCHYCGYHEALVDACKACGSVELDKKGFGTEKIEDDLQSIFPSVNIARLDLDTTRKKNAYDEILQRFADGSIDILVGTQMVTKGLDFDHVSLVGILNADNMLHFPDFRSHERAFQLMSQVSGRAGRRSKRGKVLIQTYDPRHPIIQLVQQHDYTGMYQLEILDREHFHYPPFYKLIEITLKHKDYQQVKQASESYAILLKNKLGDRVLGPEMPTIGRIRNQFIFRVIIKMERGAPLQQMKNYILHCKDEIHKTPFGKYVNIDFDVDPF